MEIRQYGEPLFDKKGIEIKTGDKIRHNDNVYIICYMLNAGICAVHQKSYNPSHEHIYTDYNWRDYSWLKNVCKYCEIIEPLYTPTDGK